MTPETAFHRHFSHDEKSSSKRDTVTGTGGSNTIKTSLSRSRPQDQPRQQAQSTLASGSDPAHNDFARDTETEMTKRLELLERRFLEPPHHITRNSCDSGGSHHSFTFDRSGSAAFRTGSRSRLSGSQTPSTRNGKSRARRGRSCTSSPSTQILENVADQHMKKVSRTLGEAPHSQPRPPPQDANSSSGMHNIHSASASAPYNPLLSPASASANSNNRSHSMSSNQTLITAHVTKRSGHGHSSGSTSAPATEVIVAESPPITYTNQERNLNLSLNKPGSFARNGATPRVARTILGETDSDSPATPSNRGKTITPTHSRAGNKRKTSVPTRLVEKKRQRNLKFHDRDHSKSETETATPSEPLTSASASANAETNAGTTMPITPIVSSLPAPNDPIENVASFSKGSLSPANNGTLKNHHHHGAGAGMGASPNVSTTSAIGNQKPSANMLITKFFGTSQSSKKKASRPLSIPSKLQHTAHKNNSGDNGNASDKVIDTTQPAGKYPKNDHLIQEIAMLKSSISSLTESLNEKSAQLKAVSNNQTIIHSQLKKSLQDRDQEIKALKEETEERNSKMRHALEKLIRKESAREHAEMRQKLASDGARLGRWIYNWVGMRRETVWEDGTAMKACDKRRNELKRKRDVLENRLKEGSKTLGDLDAMEREEFQQSIRVHLDELERAEKELKKEDDALYAEKNAHKLALKQVTNEDYSKFKSMPKLNDRYVLMSQLGKGGFSEVWRGFDLVEVREVAVKIHQLDSRWSEAKIENYTKHVAREYEIHRDVRHPRIVSLYDVLEIDDNSFATVLECCNGTDLDTLLKERKTLPEHHARAILLQILSGMKYLSTPSKDDQRQGIIHYDLKPGNILFDEFGDAKITDFGLSKIMDSPDPSDSMELTSQGAGTYWYLPPECFVTTESVRITNKVDVWSIGVIFYQMLYGKRPFGDGQSQEGVLANNVMLNAREVSFPDTSTRIVSDEAKAFICQCLAYEQALRPNVAELCQKSYVRGQSF